MAEQEATPQTENDQAQPHFSVQRLYLKDASFEAPGSPALFTKQWAPEVGLDLNTRTKKINEDLYEVVLTLTVTAKSEGETAFLIEIQQAGLFQIQNIEGPGLQHTLGAFCPTILFPYAREAVDNLANKGSFPPLMLAPVNFEALFAEQMQQQEAEAQETH
ncbi:protein-export chaperone SecB [Motiliproteus sp. MSK22-1]|uniref:protein-export chaperone SecB n=1 Tax=Motiliproteus sp. MSK22-1 TaxID=1897630 RepID=UPI000976EF47|nr:protein-export chaperone SecB [Motiliproteus sp. MSK22-1]OMH39342.1 protein-export chaperone SecB [Motiliproteus sp. MSK22-1]